MSISSFLLAFFLMIAPLSSAVLAADQPAAVNIDSVRAAAEGGDAEAQVALANAYYKGINGAPKDEAESMKWLMKAADQGNPHAEYNLSVAYGRGSTILPKDLVLSYMWLNLLISQNSKEALRFRTKATLRRSALETSLSTDDIVRGKAMAKAWQASHNAH